MGDRLPGGAHISALLLLDQLDPERFQGILVLHSEGRLSELLRAQNTRYHLLPLNREPRFGGREELLLSMASNVPLLAGFLQRLGCTVVHTNDGRMHRHWGLATRVAGCRHLWHQRSVNIAPRCGKYFMHSAHRIVTVSDYVKRMLPAFARRKAVRMYDPFVVAAPRLDRDRARAELRRELGVDDSIALVGFVGNLSRQKRAHVFAAVAEHLDHSHGPEVGFVVCGRDNDGSLKGVLEAAHRGGFGDRMWHLGFRMPVEPVIAGMDVLLAPAVREGFGRTLVEAMAVGTPLVAADSGGHREIVRSGDTGLLAPPDDVDALAEAVRTLMDDPAEAQAMAERAWERARARYSLREHVRGIETLYGQMTTG